ncbi:SAP30-binding protein [Arctopsyche grandis]|uniref:SAP30-binding protein n=1 Tax=Arctopsyche grandis TaxID=121162 RepID=UPI00406D8D38
MTSQALASLTATYTDSEGEEDMEDGQTTPEKSYSPSPAPQSNSNSPLPPSIAVGILSAPTSPRPPKRLVSYNDDEANAISDDEISTTDLDKNITFIEKHEPISKPIVTSEDDVSLPPMPAGKCPPELQEKISTLFNKMLNEGKDMNKVIQDRKSFRNPSIYEKLIQFCNINELDTNYPPEIYDPLRWGKESYCDELAKVQKNEMDKREKERKEKLSKIDFTTGLVKRTETEDDSKKRKSKWDQAAPNTSSVNMVVKPAGLVQPALTTSATGTKGTVISAFGSLPKKAKV